MDDNPHALNVAGDLIDSAIQVGSPGATQNVDRRTLEPGDTLHGQVGITWPCAIRPDMPLSTWGVSIHDANTGEQFFDVVALRMGLGRAQHGWDDNAIAVELTRLVDGEGEPLGTRDANLAVVRPPRTPHEPTPMRTAVFRYLVTEMRIAEPAKAD